MARALTDILTELDSVYNPQRQRADSLYNKQVGELQPQESADLGGLEQARTNAFESINTGANRRGMFFSGIPLAEQGKYVGENYLPSIAGLKNRYAGIRGNLYQTLAAQLGDIDTKQREFGQGIYNSEVQADIERERIAEEKRQFDARLAAEAASRAGSGGGGGGFVPTGGGRTGGSAPQTLGAQETLRQRWQREASAGDYNAQTALNYAGDDGRYDGPVNSTRELNILRSMGIQGNYYVPLPGSSGSGLKTTSSSGLTVQGGGGSLSKATAPSGGLATGLRL